MMILSILASRKNRLEGRNQKGAHTISTIEEINTILQDTVTQRVRFYKEVGEKIFRVRLDEIVEASLITLGGFAESREVCNHSVDS